MIVTDDELIKWTNATIIHIKKPYLEYPIKQKKRAPKSLKSKKIQKLESKNENLKLAIEKLKIGIKLEMVA